MYVQMQLRLRDTVEMLMNRLCLRKGLSSVFAHEVPWVAVNFDGNDIRRVWGGG